MEISARPLSLKKCCSVVNRDWRERR